MGRELDKALEQRSCFAFKTCVDSNVDFDFGSLVRMRRLEVKVPGLPKEESHRIPFLYKGGASQDKAEPKVKACFLGLLELQGRSPWYRAKKNGKITCGHWPTFSQILWMVVYHIS